MPSPVRAETATEPGCAVDAARLASRRQVGLVEHQQLGHVAGADLVEHRRARRRSGRSGSGADASTTWTSRSASATTSSVDLNASTSWWGSLRTKPTVSVSSTASPPGSCEAAGGGVEGGEQPVLDEHAGVGEPVEQRRLAGVGVADDGDLLAPAAAARLALGVAGGAAMRAQLGLELVDAAHEAAAVDLELGLARDRRVPMPPACWRERRAPAPQPGQPVAELGQLDLGLALLAVGVLGEDVEDHRGAVDGGAAEELLEVALLGRAQLVVEHDGVGVDRIGDLAQLPALPLPT